MLFRRKPNSDDLRRSLISALAAAQIDPALIGSVQVTDAGDAIVTLEIGNAPQLPPGMSYEDVRQSAERAASSLKGIKKALVILTSERQASVKNSPKDTVTPPSSNRSPSLIEVAGVGRIIAVASGKGGVGKSTVAANLAVALSRKGQRVGLLDADIYGPSVPRLMHLTQGKPGKDDSGRILPLEAHGLKVMSMGFMVDEETPMIWRGPMVQSAIIQLLRDVVWDGLDILVIDMPPGTGDAQLTLAQKVSLAGAVVVSTPQDIALLDARKGLEMFRKVAVPVLGIVENMSYYCCPNCGHRDEIFGHGGARQQAEKVGAPFLGEVPLHPSIRHYSDAGTPVVVAEPESEQARAFAAIAANVLDQLERAGRPAPKIIIEDQG